MLLGTFHRRNLPCLHRSAWGFFSFTQDQMSSTSYLPVKDLSCPVCHDIFKHPVILSCSHSLCEACLQDWWTKKPQECPVCRGKDSNCKPFCNLALKNLCESTVLETAPRVSAGWENLCSLHSEKFKLFCVDHQQPVCFVCRDSKRHTNHRFRQIDEAAQDHREVLQKTLKIMKLKLNLCNQVKEPSNQTEKQITVHKSQTEMQNEFKRLHQFSQEQEEARITALTEEEKLKCWMTKERNEGLDRATEALSSTIRAIEEELRADDVSILQNYKNTVELVRCWIQSWSLGLK